MKSAILIVDGATQIMFSPENDVDRQVLKAMTPGKEATVVGKFYTGGMFGGEHSRGALELFPSKCQGGWFRAFSQDDCRVLVIENGEEDGT